RGYIDSLDFSLGYYTQPAHQGRAAEAAAATPAAAGEYIPVETHSREGEKQASGQAGTALFLAGTLMPTDHMDIARLKLPLPLLPGDSLLISSPFRVKIPKSF